MYKVSVFAIVIAGGIPLALWSLCLSIIEVLSWLDDYEGTFFKNCSVFGCNIGFITGPDTDLKKGLYPPRITRNRDNRHPGCIERWLDIYLFCVVGFVLLIILAVLWPVLVMLAILAGILVLIRRYIIRTRKQQKISAHDIVRKE